MTRRAAGRANVFEWRRISRSHIAVTSPRHRSHRPAAQVVASGVACQKGPSTLRNLFSDTVSGASSQLVVRNRSGSANLEVVRKVTGRVAGACRL